MGHEVTVAHDGFSAILAARSTRPAIVFLDLLMPEMNGYATAKLMRQEFDSETMQIIAVSGIEAQPSSLRHAGIGHHIRKPLDPLYLAGLSAMFGSDALADCSSDGSCSRSIFRHSLYRTAHCERS
jgi:CheY-like chemotaxis protein